MTKAQQFMNRPFLDTAPYFKWPADTRPRETGLAAREQFLQVFKEHKPEFLPTIAREALPQYQSILKMGRKCFRGDLAAKFKIITKSYDSLCTSLRDQDPEDVKLYLEFGLIWIPKDEFVRHGATELYEALVSFIVKLRYLTHKLWLSEEWWFDHLLQTLNMWCRTRRRNNFDWLYRLEYYRPSPCVLEPFFFSFFPWSPGTESWASYERSMDQAYRELKLQFREKKEKQHSSRMRGPRFFAREKRERMHFSWLIEYQVNGMRMSDIAAKYSGSKGMSLATVSEAIHSLAQLLNISLRPKSSLLAQSHSSSPQT